MPLTRDDPVHVRTPHQGEQPVAEPPPSLHSGRRRQTRVLVVPLVAATVFFLGPAIAFLLGNRATEIDNRALTPFPSASQGWEAIPQLQLWANDHLPMRAQAVSAGTKISEWLFGEPPGYGRNTEAGTGPAGVAGGGAAGGTGGTGGGSGIGGTGGGGDTGRTGTGTQATRPPGAVNYPRVLSGKDGWLFLGGDVADPCQPSMTADEAVATFQEISDAVTASGREFVLVIAPDKSAMNPDQMPDTFAGRQCMTERRDEFWAAADTLTDVTLVDPRDEITAAAKKFGVNAWRKLDTHWGPVGSAVMGAELAMALDPTLLENTTIEIGPDVELRGDLSVLLGTPKTEVVPGVTLDRPGVSLTADGTPITPDQAPTVGYQFVDIAGTTTGPATLYADDTVIFGDSFLASSISYVVPYFSSMSYINQNASAVEGAMQVLANRAAEADTVVLEVVERNAVSGNTAIMTPENVKILVDTMAANPR